VEDCFHNLHKMKKVETLRSAVPPFGDSGPERPTPAKAHDHAPADKNTNRNIVRIRSCFTRV
jgi:hypothetical protein